MLLLQWLLFLVLWVGFYQLSSMVLGSSLHIRSRVAQLTVQSEEEDEEEKHSFYQRVLKPIYLQVGRKLSVITPIRWKAHLQIQLRHAGSPFGLTVNEWIVWNAIMLIICVGAAFLLMPKLVGIAKVTTLLALAVLGLFLPHFYLRRKIDQRQLTIRKGLPDLLDLLTVSVEAGLGFDQAMGKVVEKTTGPLAEEFRLTLQEVQMGKSRREALRDLGLRTGVEGVINFTNALVQADKLGVSLGNVLRVQSEDMRRKRRQEAEEKAMKAPIKLLFPLIFFIFPSLFIIILGPAAINIMNVFIK
ncbi:type II secretion system F family protein [Brevibacillus sp. H7]|uniref:type II secretion system F family protein n=1 Tax=Brevibacillus sp. H7 TaxID=3349138 RepID=UPI0037F25F0D